jgi:hypothetical protein
MRITTSANVKRCINIARLAAVARGSSVWNIENQYLEKYVLIKESTYLFNKYEYLNLFSVKHGVETTNK